MNCRTAVTWRTACLAMGLATVVEIGSLLAGCTANPAAASQFDASATSTQIDALDGLEPTAVWLLGEQHDAPAHQARQRAVLASLTDRGALAALVIEMAERGGSTQGLPPSATDTQVKKALHWSTSQAAGWDWAIYGPLVMQAVRGRVPVLGGNLPRSELRTAMQDTAFDRRLAPPDWRTQQTQIREGHCQLLPETQVVPMARAQLARDVAMAQTIEKASLPGKTVLLVAGNQHVRRDLGVPQHLPPGLRSTVVMMVSGAQAETADLAEADRVWRTEPLPPKDHCADFKAQMER